MTHEIPDFEEAQKFLNLLDNNAKLWTFQTFDDDADRMSKRLARVLHGTLSDHFDTLTKLQESGAGVFVTINEKHKGDFPGHHARYVLKSRVTRAVGGDA